MEEPPLEIVVGVVVEVLETVIVVEDEVVELEGVLLVQYRELLP